MALIVESITLGNGWTLALCLTADGHHVPWLLDPDGRDSHGGGGHGGCYRACCAPHEQLGRLPAEFQRPGR